MAVALKVASVEVSNREKMEQALAELAVRLEEINKKIKSKTDQEIWLLFQKQQQEIHNLEKAIKQILQHK